MNKRQIQKLLEEKMKTQLEPGKCQLVRCGDCGSIHETIPCQSAGDESLNVCPDCRTIEGSWTVFENCDCNAKAAEESCIPESLDGGDPLCKVCDGEGWIAV